MKQIFLAFVKQTCFQTSGLATILLLMVCRGFFDNESFGIISIVLGSAMLLPCLWLFLQRGVFAMLNMTFGIVLIEWGTLLLIFDKPILSTTPELLILKLLLLNSFPIYVLRKRTISRFLRRHSDIKTHSIGYNLISSSYRLYVAMLYLITIYTAILISIRQLASIEYAGWVGFLNGKGIILLLFILWLYEVIRIVFIVRKLFNEIWYPIIDEEGRNIGWIERKESLLNKNKYLHPAVRIILLMNDSIFLIPSSDQAIIANCIDTPLVSTLYLGETIEKTIKRMLKWYRVQTNKPPVYMCKTHYFSSKFNRMFYSYWVQIDEAQFATSMLPSSGKFWSVSQIKENLDKSVFDAIFEKEFEYIDSIILPALNYVKA